MAADSSAPVDLYIAVYGDPEAARGDWDAIKQLAKDEVIKLDGLVLVSRRHDGKIHVDDNSHETAKGAALGAVGGAVIGLIFPPAFLASAAVGAGVGAGAGALVSAGEKAEIKADVEETLPLNSSGDRRDLRAAVGQGRRKGAPERRQHDGGEGRRRQRGRGEGRGDQGSAGDNHVAGERRAQLRIRPAAR